MVDLDDNMKYRDGQENLRIPIPEKEDFYRVR